MKIYNVFNFKSNLLASFDSVDELSKYIRRHNRDKNDTTILSVELNSWNESDRIEDVTDKIMKLIWTTPAIAYDKRGFEIQVGDDIFWQKSCDKFRRGHILRIIAEDKIKVTIELTDCSSWDVYPSELYKLPRSNF